MTNRGLTQQFDELYEKYVKPLEPEHIGKYAAVAPDGRVILGTTMYEAVTNATEVLGSGSYVYKVGERVVGNWR